MVHNDSPLSPSQVWLLANSTLEDFRKAASFDFSLPRQPSTSWEPPPQGIFKINVGGATSNQGSNSSIGLIIRDFKGQVIAALSKYLQGRFVVDQVEALAMEQGVLLAQELQLASVILERDALNVIQAINDNFSGSELGHILQGIQIVSKKFESCTFKYLNREFNVLAHELAQLAHRNESSDLRKGVTPPAVSVWVQKDSLYLS